MSLRPAGSIFRRLHRAVRLTQGRQPDHYSRRSDRLLHLGNPTGFLLTGGQAHDLDGADHLLPQTHLGVRCRGASDPAPAGGRQSRCDPARKARKERRGYDRDLYKARQTDRELLRRTQTGPSSKHATTRPLATSSPPFTSPAASHLPQLTTGPNGDAWKSLQPCTLRRLARVASKPNFASRLGGGEAATDQSYGGL